MTESADTRRAALVRQEVLMAKKKSGLAQPLSGPASVGAAHDEPESFLRTYWGQRYATVTFQEQRDLASQGKAHRRNLASEVETLSRVVDLEREVAGLHEKLDYLIRRS